MEIVMFERCVFATTMNSDYIDAWEYVSKSYKTLFGVESTLGVVYNNETKDKFTQLLPELEKYGEVFSVNADECPNIPDGNQSKMFRHYLIQKEYPDTICIVGDIDLIPLRKEYLLGRVREAVERGWDKTKVMAVGSDYYAHSEGHGKFPIYHMMLTGKVAVDIFSNGIRKETFTDFLNQYKDGGWDKRCNPELPVDRPNKHFPVAPFSDESLFRNLILNNKELEKKLVHVSKGMTFAFNNGPMKQHASKYWSHEYKDEHVINGTYVEAHFHMGNKPSLKHIYDLVFKK